MNTISKTLVVFITAASLAFVGFAAVNLLGGPNWEAELQLLTEYSYEKSDGPTPEWTLTHRRSGDTVTSSRILAQLVAEALKDQTRRQQEEITRMQDEIPGRQRALELAQTVNARDRQAMAGREQALATLLAETNRLANEASLAGINKYRQAMAVRAVAERRREDVFRLREQLAEIDLETYRLIEQKRRLQDLLIQYHGVNERLYKRHNQLRKQLNPAYGEVPFNQADRAEDVDNTTAFVLEETGTAPSSSRSPR